MQSILSNSLEIPVVKHYEYLGIMIDEGLAFHENKQKLRRKTCELYKKLMPLQSLPSLPTKAKILSTLILPSISYGSQALSSTATAPHI